MADRNLIAATSNLPQVFASEQLTASEANVYQCPANSSVVIASASVCNTSGTTQTASLSVVKAGGTAGVANRVAIINLEPNESTLVPELIVLLGPGDFISGLASGASSVSITLTGSVSS